MNYLITGGHSGMGLELSKKLLAEGHRVGLIVRSESRKADALDLFKDEDMVEVFIADLSKRDSVEAVAAEINTTWKKIDGLFNNAGLLLDELQYSEYGNELQLEVNAISPYLLTTALQSLLEKAEKPFVVNTATSGLNNKKTFDISAFKRPKKFTKLFGSYMDSKLILVLLMNYLSKEWDSVRFVSIHPGAIKTQMTAGPGMPLLLKPLRHLLFKSPTYGAQNLYAAAFDPQYKESGIFVSEGKIRQMQCEISAPQIVQLLT